MCYWSRISFLTTVVVLVVGVALPTGHAGDWRKPWSSEKGEAAAQCADTFDQFQLQAVCMENEREGYDKMQGNFGLPPDIAEKAKERCARTFRQFQLQAVCMENEREGYNKMKNY